LRGAISKMSDSWGGNLTPSDSVIYSELISDAIVDYVESVVPSILFEVEIPSSEEFRLKLRKAEFRSKRMKKKVRTSFLQQIESRREFYWFINNLKRRYESPRLEHENITFRRTWFQDETAIMNGGELANPNTMIRTKRGLWDDTVKPFPREDAQVTQILDIHKGKLSDIVEYQGEQLPFTKENEILGKIEHSLSKEQFLSLSDFMEIREMLTFSDKKEVKDKVLNLIRAYLETIKRRNRVDGVEELYCHEEMIPDDLKPSMLEETEIIDEPLLKLLKAAILYEYRRQSRNSGSDYIKGKITFEEYMRKIEEYTCIAGKTYPK